MATLEQRAKASNRRGSSIGIHSNPLELGTAAETTNVKVESLADTKPITEIECTALMKNLRESGCNEELLRILDEEKIPFLFDSDSLAKLVECTTSVKTRLAIIIALSSRLSDPRSKMDYFVNLFRFSEEKSQVEDAFKSRIQAINGSLFKKEVSTNLLSPQRGGRGRGLMSSPAGRGSGRSGILNTPTRSSITGDSSDTLSSPSEIHESKPRAVSLPINRALAPIRPETGVSSVFSVLSPSNNNNTIKTPSSSSRPVDSDDDDSDSDEQQPQQTFRPFGSTPSKTQQDINTVTNKVESININEDKSNEERMQILENFKTPYLFTSEDLAKLLDVTTSIKTKIMIIASVGPRLTDPRAKTEYFISLFRFTEEKEIVEEILKTRTQALSAALFNKGDQLKLLTSGRGAGRGGAGRGPGVAGRGRGGPGAAVSTGRGGTAAVKQMSETTSVTVTSTSIAQTTIADKLVSTSESTSETISTTTVSQIETAQIAEVAPSTSSSLTLSVSPPQQSPLKPSPPPYHHAVMLSPPPFHKAMLCLTPETPSVHVVSATGLDDVFDMLDTLPINPGAPIAMSSAKDVRRQMTNMASIDEGDDRDPDDDDEGKRSPEHTRLVSGVSDECLVPETTTPRGHSGHDTAVLVDKRHEIAPSPLTREETVYETSSLKMIVETCKSSQKTSIRLVSREEHSTYHEASPCDSRKNSGDYTSIALSSLASPKPSDMLSPSSAISQAPVSPRAYDRAAMLSRLQSGGLTNTTTAPVLSLLSPNAHNKHDSNIADSEVNKVLFDGIASQSTPIRSPMPPAGKLLNISALNGTPRRHEASTLACDSADSNISSDGGSASSQLDSRHRTESLEGYFDKPRTSPENSVLKIEKPQRDFTHFTAAPSLSNRTAMTVSPLRRPSANAPAASPVVPRKVSDSSWRTRTTSSENNVIPKSPVSAVPTGSTSANSAGNRMPFSASPMTSSNFSTDSVEDELASVNFKALRSAFAKNENKGSGDGSGSAGSKQFSRRQSTGTSANFYQTNINNGSGSYDNSGTATNALSVAIPSSMGNSTDNSEPSSIRSSQANSPLLKANSTNSMSRAVLPSRRHSELTPTNVSNLLQTDSGKSSQSTVSPLNGDVAAKCAAVLKIEKTAFMALTVEEGWETEHPDGAVAKYYSYKELVRRNFTKEYIDLAKAELEKYLCDTEFAAVFQKTKEEFFAQPRWKQMDQKKKAMLF